MKLCNISLNCSLPALETSFKYQSFLILTFSVVRIISKTHSSVRDRSGKCGDGAEYWHSLSMNLKVLGDVVGQSGQPSFSDLLS